MNYRPKSRNLRVKRTKNDGVYFIASSNLGVWLYTKEAFLRSLDDKEKEIDPEDQERLDIHEHNRKQYTKKGSKYYVVAVIDEAGSDLDKTVFLAFVGNNIEGGIGITREYFEAEPEGVMIMQIDNIKPTMKRKLMRVGMKD